MNGSTGLLNGIGGGELPETGVNSTWKGQTSQSEASLRIKTMEREKESGSGSTGEIDNQGTSLKSYEDPLIEEENPENLVLTGEQKRRRMTEQDARA